MRRLNLNNIKVDTSLIRDKVIKGDIQMPSHFVGNTIHSEICPITYNDLSDNVIYYNGDEYTAEGNIIYKNGSAVFEVDNNKAVLQETSGNSPYETTYAKVVGTTIQYRFGNVSGTIASANPSYGYMLATCLDSLAGLTITLFPTTPASYREVKSWVVSNNNTVIQSTQRFAIPKSTTNALTVTNTGLVVGSKNICTIEMKDTILSGDDNHILFTVKSSNGYYYSNLLMMTPNSTTWLTNDSILLATSQDGIYYGGFKVVNGQWAIDYYNNTPVQVEYNNKIIANNFDYAFFDEGNNPVIQVGEDFYKILIQTGTDFMIVADRYLIANSPNTFNNTYDIITGKKFCRNESYAGTVLWTMNENSLTSDEDTRKTIYVATNILTNGLVDGKRTQNTLFPSFPIWGLADNGYVLLDYYGDSASRYSPIEVYKGNVNSPTVAEFQFSIGGDYIVNAQGYVYPDSTNTVYAISEIDIFESTFSNSIIIHTENATYISAVNNVQEWTFSYYVGTLNELSGVFILRGTAYGITTDGYIIAYTVESGSISAWQLITKIGTMKYVGHTQDYALFYSPYEKQLYRFDAGLKLTVVQDFSVGNVKYFTCRPEDDKIAIATEDCVYVFSNENIFQIPVAVNQLRFCQGWLLAGSKAYSSYDGQNELPVEFDTGRIGNTYDTSILLDEIIVMLDSDGLKVPGYLEYRVDVGDSLGKVKEAFIDDTNIVRIKPTTTRSEGLYYRLLLKTNCRVMGVSIIDNAEKKPNLTRNNG